MRPLARRIPFELSSPGRSDAGTRRLFHDDRSIVHRWTLKIMPGIDAGFAPPQAPGWHQLAHGRECVSNPSESLGCSAEDGSRPPEADLQEQTGVRRRGPSGRIRSTATRREVLLPWLGPTGQTTVAGNGCAAWSQPQTQGGRLLSCHRRKKVGSIAPTPSIAARLTKRALSAIRRSMLSSRPLVNLGFACSGMALDLLTLLFVSMVGFKGLFCRKRA